MDNSVDGPDNDGEKVGETPGNIVGCIVRNIVGQVDFEAVGVEYGNSVGEAVTGYWVVGYQVIKGDGTTVGAFNGTIVVGVSDAL